MEVSWNGWLPPNHHPFRTMGFSLTKTIQYWVSHLWKPPYRALNIGIFGIRTYFRLRSFRPWFFSKNWASLGFACWVEVITDLARTAPNWLGSILELWRLAKKACHVGGRFRGGWVPKRDCGQTRSPWTTKHVGPRLSRVLLFLHMEHTCLNLFNPSRTTTQATWPWTMALDVCMARCRS